MINNLTVNETLEHLKNGVEMLESRLFMIETLYSNIISNQDATKEDIKEARKLLRTANESLENFKTISERKI